MTTEPNYTDAQIEDSITWLSNKYARHHEQEDADACEQLRSLLSERQAAMQGQGGEGAIQIDLDAENWKAIKQAAQESNWIPPEYFANDWVSDVCNFLKGNSDALQPPQPVRSVLDEDLTPSSMHIGDRYNFKHHPEKLIYRGRNWSGNGYWHQFAKAEEPGKVWSEVLDADLHMIEKTIDAAIAQEKQS